MASSLNLLVLCVLIGSVVSDVEVKSNEIVERPAGWLKGAQDILAGPTGHMVVQVAKELINRSAGNTQILSLNLTNLLVIVLLKVLIFAAGLLGAGHWNHYGRARSYNGSSWIAEGEPHLFTGFLTAQGSGDNGCLYKAACHAPATAYEYARAAKALLNGIEKFEGESFESSKYNSLIEVVEKAAYDGYKGTPCDLLYKCNI